MISKVDKNSVRKKRHDRTRRHILGTAERPRLNVYRSLNHIYAQVIDDEVGHTLAAASTLDAEVKAQLEGKNKKEAANLVGEIVARRALDKGVKEVVSAAVTFTPAVWRKLPKARAKPAWNSKEVRHAEAY